MAETCSSALLTSGLTAEDVEKQRTAEEARTTSRQGDFVAVFFAFLSFVRVVPHSSAALCALCVLCGKIP
jgi:hypothetical protein